MAASNYRLTFNMATSTEFRAPIANIVAGLVAAGWTQAADAGQIDPTTAVLPAARNYAGYLLYAMSDSLQPTLPVFLKLRFGITSDERTMVLGVSAGAVTDGAGNFSGISHTKEYLVNCWRDPSNIPANDTCNMYVSGGTSRFSAALCLQTALASNISSAAPMFAVERSHDASGADTSDGFQLYCQNGDTGASYVRFGSTATETNAVPYIAFGNVSRTDIGSSGSVDNYVLSPVFPIADQFVNPFLSVLVVPSASLLTTTSPSPVTIRHYGAAHTFQGVIAPFLSPTTAMLYE